jgi:GNAT superfamily N-acetyltransferase
MNSPCPGGAPVIKELTEVSPHTAGEIAGVVRQAYHAGDLLPGLPTAGGAFETTADVLADVGDGVRLWIARNRAGDITGTVRAVDVDDHCWLLRRFAIAPRWQRCGIGTDLLDHVDRSAVVSGVRRMVAHAVVERGNPIFYAHAGFTAVKHFGTPGRPVSEVVLSRATGRQRVRLCHPFGNEQTPVLPGAVVSWFLRPEGVYAVLADGSDCAVAATRRAIDHSRRLQPVRRPLFLGADVWPAPPGDRRSAVVRAALRELVGGIGAPMAPNAFLVASDRARSYLANPREREPGLVALWRMLNSAAALRRPAVVPVGRDAPDQP